MVAGHHHFRRHDRAARRASRPVRVAGDHRPARRRGRPGAHGDVAAGRERAGRNAFYRLADGGRHAFDLATRRIYAAGPPGWNGGWTVVIAPPGFAETDAADAASLGFVRVSAGVYLRPETKGAPGLQDAFAGTLVVHGSSAEHPETLAALWPSQHTADAYRAFLSAFSPLAEALAQGTSFRGLDAAAVRALLIHDWRRIALRDPGLPAALLPADWPGEQ